MKAICRNCRQHYDTEDTETIVLEGFCSNACTTRKARRLGWRLRLGVTYKQFMRVKGIKRHKVPLPPKGIQIWGIIPLTMEKMRSLNEKEPFLGKIAISPSDKALITWIEEWIPSPRSTYQSKVSGEMVIILSRDDFRFVESLVAQAKILTPKPKRKKRNEVPKKVPKQIHARRRMADTGKST